MFSVPQNRDGKVTKKEFREIVEKFTFRLEDSQFKELMSQLNLSQGNRVSYHTFLQLFEEKETLRVTFHEITITLSLSCKDEIAILFEF